MTAVYSGPQLKTEIEQSTKDLPLLGYLVMWNLRYVEISGPTLKKELTNLGFEGQTIRPIGKHTALRRALMRWSLNHSQEATGKYTPDNDDYLGDESEEDAGPGQKKKTLVRKIKTSEDSNIVMAVVVENIDQLNMQLGYGTELRVSYSKKDKKISVVSTSAGEIENDDDDTTSALAMARYEITKLFDHYSETYLSLDLGDLIKNLIIAQNAFPVRQLGGIYFVPKADQVVKGKLENLRKLVMERFGSNNQSELTVLPQPDVKSSRKQLANAAFNSTINEIATMQEELELLEKNATSKDHKVRSWNIEKKLVIYRKLLEKSRIYRDVLGLQQDKIIALTTGLQEKAKSVIGILQQADLEEEPEDSTAPEAAEEETTVEPEAVVEYTPEQKAKDEDDIFGDIF